MIATGHYARVKDGKLYRAKDEGKDQTYFLYRVTSEALSKTLFPLGDYRKQEVREMAEQRNLWTAQKKESMGVCFVGNVGMREFLSQYVTTRPGDIIEKETGKKVGLHDGAIFYTIGQRHGLELGGGLPFYVVGKDMDKNEVYVSRNLQDTELVRNEVPLTSLHWITDAADGEVQARIRHRGQLISARLDGNVLNLSQSERAITPGQSVVIYSGEECLGGGIVAPTS
jgi:tRNA-specific 2-thiouridylase